MKLEGRDRDCPAFWNITISKSEIPSSEFQKFSDILNVFFFINDA
jgi:hypothetical protein